MIIEIEKTVKEKSQIVIDLPAYRKDGTQVFKVISEKECIGVNYSEFMAPGIQVMTSKIAWHCPGEDITEAEFNEKYDLALNRLNTLKEVHELEVQLNER